jgi:hypothetical protein
MQESAFAGTRFTRNRHELTRLDPQAHIVERYNSVLALLITPGNVL